MATGTTSISDAAPLLSSVALVDLSPEWLFTGGRRYQMGLAFTCPRHFSDCRLRLWFYNPMDGELPPPAAVIDAELYPRLVYRVGHSLDNLTLTPWGSEDRPIAVYEHWVGYCLEGRVYNATRFGVGW